MQIHLQAAVHTIGIIIFNVWIQSTFYFETLLSVYTFKDLNIVSRLQGIEVIAFILTTSCWTRILNKLHSYSYVFFQFLDLQKVFYQFYIRHTENEGATWRTCRCLRYYDTGDKCLVLDPRDHGVEPDR